MSPSRRRPVRGRPLKYTELVEFLREDELYSGASIARLASENGLLDPEEDDGLAQRRIRIALNNLARYRNFPRRGDGLITLRGQAPSPSWYGWRWHIAFNAPEV